LRSTRRQVLGAAALVALQLNASIDAARAAQLPLEQCDQLKGELASLTAAGVPAAMEQTAPAQARQLSVEQRADIARYIKVEQQLLFRCPRPPAPPEPNFGLAAVIDPNEQGEVTDGGDIVLPRAVPKKPKPAVKPALKPVAAKSVPANAGAVAPAKKTASADAAPKPKPAAKPKASDAFVPAKPSADQ
jgi:hypothetical protein